MKVKNLIVLISAVSLLLFFFLSGTDRSVVEPVVEKTYVAPESVYYNIQNISWEKKSLELDSIFSHLHKRGLFNGTVLYGEQGKTVFQNAYGYADFRNKTPLTTESAFQLASVSKMFTAAAIMLLKTEGKLGYDDLLIKYIPEFPNKQVTIRNLLNHRSGLSRYMSLADKFWDINKPISNEDVIGLFVKYNPPAYFEPDKGFHYCNTNYALLASVVERISGKPFNSFVKEKIFDRLGMNDSFIYCLKKDNSIENRVPVDVQGYRRTGRWSSAFGDYYLNGVVGDKGVYSTVEDLFKFSVALDDGTLLPKSELTVAFSPGSPSYWRRNGNYGFGWRIKSDMDSTVYHFGWWKGFRTYFIRDMKNDRVIIALTNTQRGLSSQVLWDIIQEEETPENMLALYRNLE